MNSLIDFFKNSWTLRTVLILTAIYVGSSYLFGNGMNIFEIIITFLVFLYFVWGFGKKPTKKIESD